MNNFRFRMDMNLYFGIGILKKVDEIIKTKNFKKIAIIIDKNIINLPLIIDFILLMKKNFDIEIFENPLIEPDYEFLEEFRKNFMNKNFDCIIGMGGGSTMDLAKGIAVLAKNKGAAIDFKGFPKIKNVPIPVITIPTLAGTGSEIAYNAVFTDTKNKNRLGINTEFNYPVLAIVDPLLSLSAPRRAVISAILDCVCHAIESFTVENASSFSKELSKSAFFFWCKAIKKMLTNFDDTEARSDLALASILANMALNNVGSGLGGAFSYPLGALYGIPHGIGEGLFIPYLAKFYVERGFLGYAELYDAIPESDKNINIQEKNKRFCDYLDKIYAELNVPKSLNEFGINRTAIPVLIEQVKKAFHEAPIKFDIIDAQNLFENFIK